MKYVLDASGMPLHCDDPIVWAMWFETGQRQLARDEIGDVTVSTVFLALDHNFGSGPPLLWETMVFGGEHDGWQTRYSTREDALAGHQKAVEMVHEP